MGREQGHAPSPNTPRSLDSQENSRTWPEGKLPVEIFDAIASYLTRADVRNLRLVCHEFDRQVSVKFFRNVVVPFRPQLYGNRPSSPDGSAHGKNQGSVLHSGMRIFQDFGPNILRFSLSLEIDYEALANPPMKTVQAMVPAFWGIYRWPHEHYSRYSDLEGIEKTADETQAMKDALRCLTDVATLGLYCDAGLGLMGLPEDARFSSFFPRQLYCPITWEDDEEHAAMEGQGDRNITLSTSRRSSQRTGHDYPYDFDNNFRIIKRMAMDAGFRGPQVREAAELLLETEGVRLDNLHLASGTTLGIPLRNHETEAAKLRTIFVDGTPYQNIDLNIFAVHGFLLPPDPGAEFHFTQEHADAILVHSAEEAPNEEPAGVPAGEQHVAVDHHRVSNSVQELCPLLSKAQKELLLELGWAHRAMIQSYTISIMDNSKAGLLNHLTTLSLAKIPSAYLSMFCHDELWRNLPGLTSVSLGVIPDWRNISKAESSSTIIDTLVSPLEAVPIVYKLLDKYVGQAPKIEKLHFEWLGGGELGTGHAQRNMYVLPAPFLEDPGDMALSDGARTVHDELLRLPHIKTLSLKNCWVSPAIFLQMTRQMALSSLTDLSLETVSLCGPPTTESQAALERTNMAAGMFNNPPMPVPTDEEGVRSPFPYWFTWAELLRHFSPDSCRPHDIAEPNSAGGGEPAPRPPPPMSFVRGLVPEPGRLADDETRYRMHRISLRSCGYVGLNARWVLTRPLLPSSIYFDSVDRQGREMAAKVVVDLALRACEALLGCILPNVDRKEATYLETRMGMRFGWDGVYSEAVRASAVADYIPVPGSGRFSGVLDERL